MAWAKVDDQWFAHRKVVGISLAARGLWATVLSWSCAQRTAHIPEHMARFVAGGANIDGLVGELVDAGLWVAEGDGWTIHDWSEYQDKTLSEKRAEAGRKGGLASAETRKPTPDEPKNEANAKQTKQTYEASGEAGTHPGPARPVPSQPDQQSTSPPKRGDRATRLPDDWRPHPEPDLIAAVGGQDAAARELERFRDYWRSQGGTRGRKVDWQATWRNWLRKAADDQPGNVRRMRPTGTDVANAWDDIANRLEAEGR